MDGKANGEFYVDFVPGIFLRTRAKSILEKYHFSQWECFRRGALRSSQRPPFMYAVESFSVLKVEFSYHFYHNDGWLVIFRIF
jgi:hypothetical protein